MAAGFHPDRGLLFPYTTLFRSACYLCRELLSPEGVVLAMQNAPPVKGWRLRMRYSETTDEELDPLHEDVVELPSRADARQVFMSFREDAASALPANTSAS